MVANGTDRPGQEAPPLTTRQRDVLAFIKRRIAAGRSPTFREIGEEFAIRSLNGVKCHLRALEAKGYIEREDSLARTIRLTDAAKPPPGLPLLTLEELTQIDEF